jgi:hypothetical protein
MKKQILVFSVCITILFLIGFSLGFELGQSDNVPEKMTTEEYQERVKKINMLAEEWAKTLRSDALLGSSLHEWKAIKNDVGLMLFTDRFGIRRAILYVQENKIPMPVAVLGISELAPKMLPLQK